MLPYAFEAFPATVLHALASKGPQPSRVEAFTSEYQRRLEDPLTLVSQEGVLQATLRPFPPEGV